MLRRALARVTGTHDQMKQGNSRKGFYDVLYSERVRVIPWPKRSPAVPGSYILGC